MTNDPPTFASEAAAIADGFAFEVCEECGLDLMAHRIAPDPLGHAHSWCRYPDYREEFVRGYALAMLWANTHYLNDAEGTRSVDPYAWQSPDADWPNDAFSVTSRGKIHEDCAGFVTECADLLTKAADEHGYTAGQAGHDFALTRNRHGAGFWDRGLGSIGDVLTNAAHVYGESTAWAADDDEYAHLN